MEDEDIKFEFTTEEEYNLIINEAIRLSNLADDAKLELDEVDNVIKLLDELYKVLTHMKKEVIDGFTGSMALLCLKMCIKLHDVAYQNRETNVELSKAKLEQVIQICSKFIVGYMPFISTFFFSKETLIFLASLNGIALLASDNYEILAPSEAKGLYHAPLDKVIFCSEYIYYYHLAKYNNEHTDIDEEYNKLKEKYYFFYSLPYAIIKLFYYAIINDEFDCFYNHIKGNYIDFLNYYEHLKDLFPDVKMIYETIGDYILNNVLDRRILNLLYHSTLFDCIAIEHAYKTKRYDDLETILNNGGQDYFEIDQLYVIRQNDEDRYLEIISKLKKICLSRLRKNINKDDIIPTTSRLYPKEFINELKLNLDLNYKSITKDDPRNRVDQVKPDYAKDW